MTRIEIAGCGAVSPAGWGVLSFQEALKKGEPIPAKEVTREGRHRSYRIRHVPPPSPRPAFLAHARLRRTSPIAQFSVAAAVEALGADAAKVSAEKNRLGAIVTVMSACVNYSRRFYDEALKDPSTASPLVFPETVFNAPASHLAALLGSTGINYTLVGDPGTFLQGLGLAADWLLSHRVDGCLVVGAEESDWVTAEAFTIFERKIIMGEGAGALYLRREQPGTKVFLNSITEPSLYTKNRSRSLAAIETRAQLLVHGNGTATKEALLCDGLQNVPRQDEPERAAWTEWPANRLSVKAIFGEGLMAGAAWQSVAGADAVARGQCHSAIINVVGTNQQAIAAEFVAAASTVQKTNS
jgi:3-oxoacyl-[acyl-carrier-protein] synthase II